MGASQIAILEQILRDLYVTFEADPNVDWCLTFEVPGRDVWLEFTRRLLNMAWPFDSDAAYDLARGALQSLPECVLAEVEAGSFATYWFELPSVEQMAAIIDRLFVEVYQLEADYQFTFEVKQL